MHGNKAKLPGKSHNTGRALERDDSAMEEALVSSSPSELYVNQSCSTVFYCQTLKPKQFITIADHYHSIDRATHVLHV